MLKLSFSEATKKLAGSSDALKNAVLEEDSRLEDQFVGKADAGSSGHTLIFREEVIKGPLNEKDIARLEQECRILHHIKDKNLRVPELTRLGKKTIFFGMTRLPGTRLTNDTFKRMTKKESAELARDVGGFMAGFANAFTDKEAEDIIQLRGMPTLKIDSVEAALGTPAMRAALGDDLAAAEKAVREYKQTLLTRKQVVLHDDFNPNNLMVDPETRKSTGVIDFGHVNMGLPEEGFAAWLKPFPPEFTREICSEYARQGGQKIEYKDVVSCRLAYEINNLAYLLEKGDQKNAAHFRKEIAENLQALREPAPHAKAKPSGGRNLRHLT